MLLTCLNVNCCYDKIIFKSGDVEDGRIVDINEFDVEVKNKNGRKSYRKYDISKILLKGDTIKYNHSLTDLVYIRTDEARENLCTEFFDCESFRSCDKQLTKLNSLVYKNGDYCISDKILARIKIIEEIERKAVHCDWYTTSDCSGLQITYKIKISEIIIGNPYINNGETVYTVNIRTSENSNRLNVNEQYIAVMDMKLVIADCEIKERMIVTLISAFGKAYKHYKLRYGDKYHSYEIRNKLFTLEEIKDHFYDKKNSFSDIENDTVKLEKDHRKPVGFLIKLALVNFIIFVLPFIILRS